jgi:hypothetical protein
MTYEQAYIRGLGDGAHGRAPSVTHPRGLCAAYYAGYAVGAADRRYAPDPAWAEAVDPVEAVRWEAER